MKSHISLIVFMLLFNHYCVSQIVFDVPEQEKRKLDNRIFGSFQATIGIITPSAVNDFIQKEISRISPGGAIFYQGSPEISMAGSLNFSLLYRFKKNFQISIPLEYTGASKTIVIDRTTLQYSIGRFCTGGIGSYLIPMQNETAFYLGFGMLYQTMWFEKVNASKFGPRVEMGFTRFGQKADLEFFLHFDSAEGIANQPNNSIRSIDFSGLYLGSRIVF